MNNFRINCKENVTLRINGANRTFQRGKSYGFINISDKETQVIRKQAIKTNSFTFTLTNNTLGCYGVIYGVKEVKDKQKENIINMNKGKKKNKQFNFKIKESVEEKKEESEETVPPVDENDTISAEVEEINE